MVSHKSMSITLLLLAGLLFLLPTKLDSKLPVRHASKTELSTVNLSLLLFKFKSKYSVSKLVSQSAWPKETWKERSPFLLPINTFCQMKHQASKPSLGGYKMCNIKEVK